MYGMEDSRIEEMQVGGRRSYASTRMDDVKLGKLGVPSLINLELPGRKAGQSSSPPTWLWVSCGWSWMLA